MWRYLLDRLPTIIVCSMFLVSVIGYSCVIAPPARCVGSCSDSPCASDIGCGFDCFCVKFGSDQWGSCARTDW